MKYKIIILAILILLISSSVLARPLEIDYPEFGGIDIEDTTTPIPDYVNYIFNFAIFASGFIAVGVIVFAGYDYFLSAGNPEKMSDAKSKILAALLGLLILFGSYLLLYSINPDLVSFNLPRLKPIISELTPGVLACTEEMNVGVAWELTREFKNSGASTEEEKNRLKEIKKLLDGIFEDISENCYMVLTSKDVRIDLNNRIRFIYFIPGIENNEMVEYGATIYEESGFNGRSLALLGHLRSFSREWKTHGVEIDSLSSDFRPSSIKPFQLIYRPEPEWTVTLYQDYNLESQAQPYNINNGLWHQNFSLPWTPRSMKIEGGLLAILVTSDNRSETFSKGIYNNLEGYSNIIDRVSCKEYESQESTLITIPGAYGGTVIKRCFRPAASSLIIISGSTY